MGARSPGARSLGRLLLAFACYRWWSLRGRLRSRRRNDVFARFSRWVDPLMKFLMVLVLLPSLLGFGLIALALGFFLGARPDVLDQPNLVIGIQVMLLMMAAVTVMGPMLMGGSGGQSELGRLLLLPISRTWLFGLRYASTLADPWNLGIGMMALVLPLGYALGCKGREELVTAEVIAGVGILGLSGVVFWLGNAALGYWIYLLAQRVLADRRRAETLVMIAFVVPTVLGLSMISLPESEAEIPSEVMSALIGIHPVGEPFLGVMRAASTVDLFSAIPALLLQLTVLAGLLYLCRRAHDHLLLSGGQSRERQAGSAEQATWGPDLPFLGPAVSAVARVQLRTFWRTVPGKLALLQGPFMVLIGSLLVSSPADLPFLRPELGLGLDMLLLSAGMTFALLSIQPFLFNTFAIDGAGASLRTLLPIDDRSFLLGKGAAWSLALFANLLASLPIALALAWPGWLAALRGSLLLFLATAGCLVVFVPAGLLASSFFPKGVDLSKPIQGNQPHGLSIVLGLALLVPTWGLPLAILLIPVLAFGSYFWAFVGLATWLVLALLLGWGLLLLAEAAHEPRWESVLLEVQGR